MSIACQSKKIGLCSKNKPDSLILLVENSERHHFGWTAKLKLLSSKERRKNAPAVILLILGKENCFLVFSGLTKKKSSFSNNGKSIFEYRACALKIISEQGTVISSLRNIFGYRRSYWLAFFPSSFQ